MTRRSLSRATALVCAVALGAALAVTPIAEPDAAASLRARSDDVTDALADPARQSQVQQLPGDRWLVPFRATEVGAALRLSGETNETVVNLPVIDGTVPVAIRAQLTASPDVDSGYIEYQGAGVPSRLIDFAQLGGRPSDTPVTLDLRGMQAVNGQLKLTLRSRLRSTDPGCVTSLLGAWVEFREGGLLLTGQERPPTSVATYFPKLLERLEVYLPAEPSPAEATAALRVAQTAQRQAIGRNPQVVVVPLTDPARAPDVPYSSGVRQIAVSGELPAGIALAPTPAGGTVLTLGGDTGALDRTSTALSSDWRQLALGTQVDVQRVDLAGTEGVVPDGLPAPDEPGAGSTTTTVLKGSDPDDPSLRNTQFTLDQMKVGTERVTGLGRLELPIRATQTTLGGPVRSVAIHLEGVLTPIAKGADATLSLLVNNRLVRSTNLAGFTGEANADGKPQPGRFTMDATVADESVGRGLDVTVVVDYTPPGGECRLGDVPFMLQLDPRASTLTIEAGQTLAPGFERFPQTLLPRFDIGLDRFDLDRVALAFGLVLSMQRTSSKPLRGDFTGLDAALRTARPALLVSQWTPGLLRSAALLSADPVSYTDDQRVERLRLQPDQPRAILEAFQYRTHDRMLLTWSDGTAGAGSGLEQANALVASIGTRTTDFSSLFGDTYLISTGTPPLSISLRGDRVQPTPDRPGPDYVARATPLLIAAVVIGLIVLAMAWLRRRRRRAAAAATAPEPTGPGDDPADDDEADPADEGDASGD